jgi:hypothetical protein
VCCARFQTQQQARKKKRTCTQTIITEGEIVKGAVLLVLVENEIEIVFAEEHPARAGGII